MDPNTLPAAVQKDLAFLQTPEARAIIDEVERRFAGLPQTATLTATLDRIAPGWKTSEFWITLFAQVGFVLAAATGVLPPKYAALAAAGSQVAYILSRGFAKQGN